MKNRLYVGNLPFTVTDQELKERFQPHGRVISARVVLERESGDSRGFAFVEMSSEDEAQLALEQMDGKEFSGRPISVTFAEAKVSKKTVGKNRKNRERRNDSRSPKQSRR